MGYNSVPLKPPCTNITDNTASKSTREELSGRPLYILVRDTNPDEIIDYWVNTDRVRLSVHTVFNYFNMRKLEAEEDPDLIDALPKLKLYLLELPATITKFAFDRISKNSVGQTQHFDCDTTVAQFICKYGRVIKTCNFLDYCSMPERY